MEVERDVDKGLAWLKRAANLNDIAAQLALAHIYMDGDLISEDLNESFYWFQKAANLGDASAQYEVGSFYMVGMGDVEANEKLAFYWHKKAAEQGVMGSQMYIGYAFKQGYVVAVDINEAMKWFQKAAEQGSAQSQSEFEALYSNDMHKKQDLNVHEYPT